LHQPFFLYVARLEHPAKNHVRLVSAFDEFKQATRSNWQLVLGGSDWHGAEAIHAAIRQSPFARDIRRLGFVPDAALPELYRAADAFVYPSLYEGFGMPPLEAMACGCPSICSRRGSLGEIAGPAAAIVDPEDIHAMAGQLAALVGDADWREGLRRTGLARAKTFDWRRTATETLKIYERAVTPAKNLLPVSLKMSRG
jgi:glycosyltransferase involved in cell wall biosynthesis